MTDSDRVNKGQTAENAFHSLTLHKQTKSCLGLDPETRWKTPTSEKHLNLVWSWTNIFMLESWYCCVQDFFALCFMVLLVFGHPATWNLKQGQNIRHKVALIKFQISLYYDQPIPAELLQFLQQFSWFWAKFRSVAESPLNAMEVKSKKSIFFKRYFCNNNLDTIGHFLIRK